MYHAVVMTWFFGNNERHINIKDFHTNDANNELLHNFDLPFFIRIAFYVQTFHCGKEICIFKFKKFNMVSAIFYILFYSM